MMTEQNKAVVIRFNKEGIEAGNAEVLREILAADCVNHTAPAGAPNGPDSMIYFLNRVLKTGFPDLTVTIHDQLAEGDKVTTRKEFRGTHTGEFMGVPPTHKSVVIRVIDLIRLRDGQYVEHWGMSNLPEVIAELSGR
ncbi:ester cyclase [Larkinella bovis]|uniref:Ester cyclase n=1 Tax=Larkinella bovis TaxID=683041 RepID=A0ABW0ICD1_9BACT